MTRRMNEEDEKAILGEVRRRIADPNTSDHDRKRYRRGLATRRHRERQDRERISRLTIEQLINAFIMAPLDPDEVRIDMSKATDKEVFSRALEGPNEASATEEWIARANAKGITAFDYVRIHHAVFLQILDRLARKGGVG